jgi:regulator of sigma E protease
LLRPNEQVPISIERGSSEQVLNVRLGSAMLDDATGRKMRAGVLGVRSSTRIGDPVPVYRAVPMAVDQTARLTGSIVDGLVQLVRGRVSTNQLGGPITIARVAGQGAELGLFPFIGLLALLSINLGFINLLPVPMLDGGHLFFYAVEAVRRRPLSARAQEWAFRGGLAVILALVLFTTINDLGSLGLWDRLQRLIG